MKRVNLSLIAFIFVVAGILTNLMPLLLPYAVRLPAFTTFLYGLCPYYFRSIFEIYINNWGKSSYSLNFFNLYLYTSFLAGAIAYYATKGKDIRLLRFNFGMMIFNFLLQLPFLLEGLFWPPRGGGMTPSTESNPLQAVMYVSALSLSLFIAFKAVLSLNKRVQTEIEEENLPGGHKKEYSLPATKSQRFLNHLIDSILIAIYIICTVHLSFRSPIVGDLFDKLETGLGQELSLLIVCATAKFIYFFVFEVLFASSPGKMLTQTRVSDKSGNKAGLIAILKRTLCRLIPLEAFTFFTGYNLHDKLSNTYVIREQQKGIAARVYLWIMLPLFLVIAIATTIFEYLN